MSLDLSYSNLSRIPENIMELKIQTLNLSNNKITKIENIPSSVIYLDLSGNQIQTIENLPENLKILNLGGYSLNDSHETRVSALKKAIKDNSELKVLRHVNALRTYQKSNEKYYNKLDKDMKWLQKDYAKRKGGACDKCQGKCVTCDKN